jgi:hypothetical protein
MRLFRYSLIMLLLAFFAGCSGTHIINSEPEGASIYSYQGYKGDSLHRHRLQPSYLGTTRFDLTAAPNRWYMVKKTGYEDSKWIYLAWISQDKDRAHTFYLNPIQEKGPGHLSIKCDGEFHVKIDQNAMEYHPTDLFLKELESGQHELFVWKEYYLPVKISTEIKANSLSSYQVNLIPVEMTTDEFDITLQQGKGEIIFLTSNPGIEIVIQGKTLYPPVRLGQISAGKYPVQIKHRGVTKTIDVEINDGDNEVIDLDKELNLGK